MQKFVLAAALAIVLAAPGCSQLQSLNSGDLSQSTSSQETFDFAADPARDWPQNPD